MVNDDSEGAYGPCWWGPMEATYRGGYEGGDACATWIDGLRENRGRGAEELETSAVTERIYEDAFIMTTKVEARQQTLLHCSRILPYNAFFA
jgi:hypothetical protein